jgi:FlaA1/EpsC-like NDP-sugar epimerase
MHAKWLRFYRNPAALIYDVAAAGLAFILAMRLRLDEDFSFSLDYVRYGLPVFMAVALCVFLYARLYRASWRYASLHDLFAIARSAALVVLLFVLAMFLFTRLQHMPRSALPVAWMLMVGLMGAARLACRQSCNRSGGLFAAAASGASTRIPVLLVGAGDAAEQFIRDAARNPGALYAPVAMVDDAPQCRGFTIHNVPVYHDTHILPRIVEKLARKGLRPQRIIVTDDRLEGEALRRLLQTADTLGLPLSRLPRRGELRDGSGNAGGIQPIAVEDLLGRAQNVLDREAMRRLSADKTVLITGAGGTIGGELARQVAASAPKRLVLAELSEFHLYQIEREIRARFPDVPLHFVLCDIRDRAHVDALFARFSPQIVLHAAAIKHVPIAEFNIEEAILTNVMGTRHIADACARHQSAVMLMISTDKAVNPTNVMGATKRLAESYCQALGQASSATQFITVRFGNVLGSTGSVVPLFQEQIAKGGPVTVTHVEMTRYFMTVREAVELVLQAATLAGQMQGRRECIFVLDMGEPMKIIDLARQMIRLAGLAPERDIEITFTGLRPGEKLHEELFHGGENVARTEHKSIFLASPRAVEIEALRRALEPLEGLARARDTLAALNLLKTLVPEFNHDPRYPAL